MYKYIFITPLLLFIAGVLSAQSGVDFILQEIDKNNKEIQSGKQFGETKKLEYKTGIFLKNPVVEYDYLIGSPTGTGNQSELYVTQEFDFPSVYSKRKKVSDLQISTVETQTNIIRREIILEAKKYCIEIIYLNKKQIVLKQRTENAKSLFEKIDKRVKTGEANMLDFNKAKVNLLNSENDMQLNAARINVLLQKLAGINANNPVTLTDTIFPLFENIPEVSNLQNQYAANDPLLKTLQLEKEVGTAQISLAKALSLPKIQAGFHSQSNAGFKFNGIHLGITIPLWENKNTVKYAVAKSDYNTSLIDNRQFQINSKINEIYTNCISLKKSIDDYKQVLQNLNDVQLLDKALQLGHISAIEYLLEISFVNQTIDKYLLLEYEYNLSVADLYKFKL